MDYECKRSGQIPAFGNWDYANDLPITQYFESARQAGLLRHSSFSGDADLYGGGLAAGDNFYEKPPPAHKKTRVRERRCPHVKEQKKQGKVCDVVEPPLKPAVPQPKKHHQQGNDVVPRPRKVPARAPKAVDEDLYKIPPELLRSSKPKRKMLGYISRCLAPTCSA